jgi:uncharacterized protein GlcG (DUF336 family)
MISILTIMMHSYVMSAEPSFTIKQLTPETALKAAQAGLKQCRALGYQVTIVVADRSGQVQVLLRDRLSGVHTIEAATNKAWTAVSFKTNTALIAKSTQSGHESSGIREMSKVLAIGGGITIDIGGTLYGAIGVSGAPTGTQDEMCAKAAIDEIAIDLEFN